MWRLDCTCFGGCSWYVEVWLYLFWWVLMVCGRSTVPVLVGAYGMWRFDCTCFGGCSRYVEVWLYLFWWLFMVCGCLTVPVLVGVPGIGGIGECSVLLIDGDFSLWLCPRRRRNTFFLMNCCPDAILSCSVLKWSPAENNTDEDSSHLGLYSFTIFCLRYRQLIIAIISVIADKYGRNIDAAMTWPISNTKEHIRGLAHSSVLEISQVVTAPNRKQYYARLFSKIKTKQHDGMLSDWFLAM